MLTQLVCLDRRYQRMNCFNIREIQTLLKARFYADLLNESSHHLFLNKTTLGLRFKLQDLNFLNLNSLLDNRYGISAGTTNRFENFSLSSTSTSFLNATNTLYFTENNSAKGYYTVLTIFSKNLFSWPLVFSHDFSLPPYSFSSIGTIGSS